MGSLSRKYAADKYGDKSRVTFVRNINLGNTKPTFNGDNESTSSSEELCDVGPDLDDDDVGPDWDDDDDW